jgi:hypothetical protein
MTPGSPLVSNTSPPLYLGRIGQVELLPQLFSQVYVPEQVTWELDAGRLIRSDTPDPRQFPWVTLVSVTDAIIATLPASRACALCAGVGYYVSSLLADPQGVTLLFRELLETFQSADQTSANLQ